MTKKPEHPVPGESEALHQLMISLYGGETEARQVAAALLRNITSEEEELLQRRYDRADEIARQIAREHVSLADPDALSNASSDFELLSEQEEKELLSFMEAVYRRVETAENSPTESTSNPHGSNVHLLPEKARGVGAHQSQTARLNSHAEEPVRILAAASSEQVDETKNAPMFAGPERLESVAAAEGTITFWAQDQSVYVTVSSAAQPAYLVLGSEAPRRLTASETFLGFFLVENITSFEAEAFLEQRHHSPDEFEIHWS